MLLSIDPDGPASMHQEIRDSIVPIYQQIRNRIVEAIAAGELLAGSGLPATRQLAVDLGINFRTVNKAYDLLRREGLLRIGRRAGAVVQRDVAGGPSGPGSERDWAGRLRTLLAEAAAQGLPADGIIRHCQAAVARFAFPAGPARGRQRGGNPVMTSATRAATHPSRAAWGETDYGCRAVATRVNAALLAGCSIWPASPSPRARWTCAPQQVGMFASLPPLGIVAFMSFNVITPTLGLARARRRAADRRCLGWRAVAMFDRERLVTGMRS